MHPYLIVFVLGILLGALVVLLFSANNPRVAQAWRDWLKARKDSVVEKAKEEATAEADKIRSEVDHN